MRKPRKQLPKYCRHKATNRAFVRIAGKTYYLGKYNSEASRQEYDRIIREFVAGGRQPFNDPDSVSIAQLITRFLGYAENYYGQEGMKRFVYALRHLYESYSQTAVNNFGPIALKELRQTLIDKNLARNTINKMIHTIRQVFYWGWNTPKPFSVTQTQKQRKFTHRFLLKKQQKWQRKSGSQNPPLTAG